MSCWNRFDFRAVQMFSGYPKRAQGIREELERIGCDAQEFWECPNPFYRYAKDAIKSKATGIEQDGFFNLQMGRYRIMRTALDLGAQHVLIFEDDARFIKDLDELKRRVDGLPGDYDFAGFDWETTPSKWQYQRNAPKDEFGWAPKWIRMYGFSAYAISKRAAENLVRMTEEPTRGVGMLRHCDGYINYLPKEFKCYVAMPPLAVQGVVDRVLEAGHSHADGKWRGYSACNVTRDVYECPKA